MQKTAKKAKDAKHNLRLNTHLLQLCNAAKFVSLSKGFIRLLTLLGVSIEGPRKKVA